MIARRLEKATSILEDEPEGEVYSVATVPAYAHLVLAP
jgi:hypothetical protein